MGILDGNQKHEPMHYGEIYGVWSYLLVVQSTLIENQIMVNHTGDKDLKDFLERYTTDVLQPQIKELTDLLKKSGVTLPPSPPERANVNLEDIPPGARVMDVEIANSRAKLIATGLVACSTIIGNCTREDLCIMFEQFHTKKAKLGFILLKLLKEKGWLVLPPLHNPGGHNS